MMSRTRLALAALIALASCGENAEKPAGEDTATVATAQDSEFAGDVEAATRKAAADTEAAAREAGVANLPSATSEEPAAPELQP